MNRRAFLWTLTAVAVAPLAAALPAPPSPIDSWTTVTAIGSGCILREGDLLSYKDEVLRVVAVYGGSLTVERG